MDSTYNIIVIGASAGGMEAIKALIGGLPKDFPHPIFIVWHMSPEVHGVLPQVLSRIDGLPAANAYDGEPIVPGRIYVAPPDHHLLIEEGRVRVTHGPKENRFRPAVDPLFRSAAYVYGPRVVGIILTGALDDGTAGLWTIKHHGGTAIVQEPAEAAVPSMPQSALRKVAVDYCLPIAEMPAVLMQLSNHLPAISQTFPMNEDDNKRTELEISIAAEDSAFERGVMGMGELTPFTCPECHGVLMGLRDGGRLRYRCHTGHAFSADSLLASVTENIEDGLWSAIRGVEESVMLLNHMGDHFAETNNTALAAAYFRKASEALARVQLMRQAVLTHEVLTNEKIEVEDAQREGKE